MPESLPGAVSLDLSGLRCPLPVLQAKKALAKISSGEVIELICTDPATPTDLYRFCSQTGNCLLRHWQADDKFLFLIQKR